MKHLKYFFVLLLGMLFAACPADVLDPDDPGNPNIPTDPSIVLKEKIEKIVPVNVLGEAKLLGMPVYDGVDPPTITGSYVLDDQTMKKSNIEGDEPFGTKYVDEVLTISNQNNDNFTATVKLESEDEVYTYNAVISGSGDKFTLYISMNIAFEDKTSSKAVILYSGVLKDDALHDLHYGMFFVEQPYTGMGHVIYEADGIAHKKEGDPGEDIVVAEGETATGEFTGSDLTMQFPSDLSVTIKASNNQGADHGTVTISEFKEFPMMELGDNIVLDFSETSSVYTIDVETFIAKGLDAEEDIDCSLFTIDKQAIEASNGRIYKSIDFNYDKETGKLTFSTKVNTPFESTRSSGGRYSHLAIDVNKEFTVGVESVTMKAPYVEQLDNTCWAACAMMFIRSYTNLEPDMRNSYLAFVKRMGHERLDLGWTTNFITFWKYDTGNLVAEIERMIGGGIKVSSASFRRTKSAANEMVKLINQRKPVMLNHGEHVLYVIGYRRTSGSEAISFLVHDPQGKSGDIYKWIDWEDYLKKNKFNEAFFRGDALYIIYADKPMLDNPVLQTMAVATADTEKFIRPPGTDLTFYMQAYDKSRMVFPQYDINELYGLRWGKKGYDEDNLSNDTIYSLSKLTVGMKIFNADDKAVSMSAGMNISSESHFKRYTADISCPAGGEYIVKENQFKESNGKDFDPTLKDFFKQPGDPDLYVDFSFYNQESNFKDIDKFEYPRLIIKSDTIEEPEEFKALRPILEDVYTSATGKEWSERFVWLEEAPEEEWPYKIVSKDGESFEISAYANILGKCFNINLNIDPGYFGNIKVENHPLPDGWTWALYHFGQSKEIEIDNDYMVLFFSMVGDYGLKRLIIDSSEKCFVALTGAGYELKEPIEVDFKNTFVKLEVVGIKDVIVKSVGELNVEVDRCEHGTLTFSKPFEVSFISIHAHNYEVKGSNNTGACSVSLYKGSSEEPGTISLSGLNTSLIENTWKYPLIRELIINDFTSKSLAIYVNRSDVTEVKDISINNCLKLEDLIINADALENLNVTNCPKMSYVDLEKCSSLSGGSFGRWPIPFQEMYNSGKGENLLLIWRYSYWKECDEYGENCEYVLDKDKGYGFYFDESEPNSVDVEKYKNVGVYF